MVGWQKLGTRQIAGRKLLAMEEKTQQGTDKNIPQTLDEAARAHMRIQVSAQRSSQRLTQLT